MEQIKALILFYSILLVPFIIMSIGFYLLSEKLGLVFLGSSFIILSIIFIINYLQISFKKEAK